MNNVLITGGSGYFGSILISKLLSQNKYNINSLDINVPDEKGNFTYYNCDILDYEKLRTITKNIDIIYHNVAQVPLAKNKKLFHDVNIQGTKNICKVGLDNGVKKIVYTSSSAIYGVPKTNPVNELTVPVPAEEYGKTKLIGEKICQEFACNDLQFSIIRPRTIVGHGRLGIFSLLFKWISEGVNVPVLNEGKNNYQFVHANDLADACISSSIIDSNYEDFNIGSDDISTMYDTLNNLCNYANTGAKVFSLPLKPVEIGINIMSSLNLIPLGKYHSLMYGRSLYFDINKAKKELCFNPKFTTDQMFRESYDKYLNTKDQNNINNSHHKKQINESAMKIIRYISNK